MTEIGRRLGRENDACRGNNYVDTARLRTKGPKKWQSATISPSNTGGSLANCPIPSYSLAKPEEDTMTSAARTRERRTSVDVVFDTLHNAIVTLEMLPGDKISEAEIAAQFSVSRQPVRDAFSRLV